MWTVIRGLIDLLTPQLAKVFDTFKASSPIIAAAIVSVLIGVQYFADNCMLELCNGAWFDTVKYALMALLGVMGSRTTRYLPEKKTSVTKIEK